MLNLHDTWRCFLDIYESKIWNKNGIPYSILLEYGIYPAGKIGIQVVSFSLPSEDSDLPIVSIGIDNLSKSIRYLPNY